MAAATLAAARAARQAGVRVSFDGNFRPRLWQRWGGDAQAVLRELFAQADIVFADYRDMEVVLGTRFTQPDLMERIDAALPPRSVPFRNCSGWPARSGRC